MPNRTSARQRPRREDGSTSHPSQAAAIDQDLAAAKTVPNGDRTTGDRTSRRRRSGSRRRRYLRWGLILTGLVLLGIVGILVLLGVAGFRAYPAAADLMAGRDAMVDGRRAIGQGELEQASAAFERGIEAFADAERQLAGAPVRAARAVPLAGRTFTAVADLAAAGRVTGEAALEVSQGLEALPGGALTLAPDDGVIPLEPLQQIQPVLQSALSTLQQADELMAVSPRSLLAPPVRDAQRELTEQLQAGENALTAAEGLARALPPFFGAEGTRRYFFGAANPAEVRGTGGLIGAYAILTAENGELQLSDFSSTTNLPVLFGGDVDPPGDDFARRYNEFGGAGLVSNINMTPDFPSAAVAIENHYAAATGERLDGVIVADPFALQALLELTGPTRAPGVGRVDAENVVPLLANRAYEAFDNKVERQSVLGDVSEAVLTRFLEGDVDASPAKVLTTLGRAAGQRRLQFHSTDEGVQQGLGDASLTGALPQDGGDFLAVVPNNGAANKADYFMDWTIDYEVWLEDGGDARAQVRVEAHNATPQKGPRRYVIGPNVSYLQAGDNLTYLTVFCAPGCEHSHAKQNDAQDFWLGTDVDTELGFTTLSSWQWAHSEGTTDMQYTLQLPDVWTGTQAEAGEYKLHLRTPPLARPAEVNVVIHPPHPLYIAEVSEPMELQSGQAVWSGSLETAMDLRLVLARPPRDALAHRTRIYAERVRQFWNRRL